MSKIKLYPILTLFALLAFLLPACGGATSSSNTTELKPTELHVAAVLTVGPEQAWDKSFLDSFKRVQTAAPHGLKIADITYTENVFGDQAEEVMRGYAQTGMYDIIWANSSYSDQVKKLRLEFPEILWVVVGSGNEGMGGNGYFIFQHMHEPSYLLGMLAGYLTKSNIIGVVSTFPADDVNDVNNAFIAGAKSVNPDVKARVTYIQSWYDPAKGAEAGYAQIAAGADQMLMSAEAFDVCTTKHIMCYAHYIDYYQVAPDAIVASLIMNFDPAINYSIDQWWDHKTTGAAYDAPVTPVWFPMAEGSSELSSYHDFENIIPQNVKDAVAQKEQDIMSGKFTVPLDLTTPNSDF
jgi:basic membrane protein A and related proteins